MRNIEYRFITFTDGPFPIHAVEVNEDGKWRLLRVADGDKFPSASPSRDYLRRTLAGRSAPFERYVEVTESE